MHLRIRPVPFQHDFCHRRHRRKNQKWFSPPAKSDVAQTVVGGDLLGGGQSHRHHRVMECRRRFDRWFIKSDCQWNLAVMARFSASIGIVLVISWVL